MWNNLHHAFQESNQQLKSNLNPHLKFTPDRDWIISTPKQDATLSDPLKNYFPSHQLPTLNRNDYLLELPDLTNKLTEMPDEHQRQSVLESIKAGSIIT